MPFRRERVMVNNIKNSVIALTADIADNSIVLNSTIGELCMVEKNCRFCYSTMGDLSYVSVNTHVFSAEIGKYCSISWNVSIGPAQHDFDRISSHAMLYATRFKMINKRYYDQYRGGVKLGNDVWIGCNTTIMRGVTIGDGAVIGANSVITKDVPPYAIVCGVNKFLRWRFDEEARNRLLEIKWWDYPIECVKDCIELISKKPTISTLNYLEKKLKSL